jgi:hypothetical protein
MKPGVRIQGPIAHVAATRNQTAPGPKPAPSRKPVPASPIAHVATPSRYPPNTASKDYMSKIQYRACDKYGHFAKDCTNPSNRPISERPNSYARAKSPALDKRDPHTPSTANVAIEISDNTYGWDNEETGLGCVTVQTAPVSIGFNSIYLTDTVTNLPITTHTPVPSLLDDGDVESHPGPNPVSPAELYFDQQKKHRQFNASQTQQRSNDDSSYSDSANVANDGQESEYDVASITMPILTEHIVENLLNHMDAAQNEAIKAEQASRGRALKPSAYVRQMKPSEIETSATGRPIAAPSI